MKKIKSQLVIIGIIALLMAGVVSAGSGTGAFIPEIGGDGEYSTSIAILTGVTTSVYFQNTKTMI